MESSAYTKYEYFCETFVLKVCVMGQYNISGLKNHITMKNILLTECFKKVTMANTPLVGC